MTPEAGPLSETGGVQPPTWREQMRGPIPGLDNTSSGTTAQAGAAPSSGTDAGRATTSTAREAMSGSEGRQAPKYIGKPVSEVPWGEALKVARPVLSLAERMLITTIDLTGQGLTSLAQFLERQRQERERRGS
jgi:hypothetical protein